MAFPVSQDLIQDWFTYHSPTPRQVEKYQLLRDKAKEYAELFVELSLPCADQTVALRMLRETNMMMNATIACNEKGEK